MFQASTFLLFPFKKVISKGAARDTTNKTSSVKYRIKLLYGVYRYNIITNLCAYIKSLEI